MNAIWKESLVSDSYVELLGDIDIDCGDRKRLLAHVTHIPASVQRNGKFAAHNTGVYFHKVPVNPFTDTCSLNYDVAEKKNCYKIDLLNNHIYDAVQSEAHLDRLIATPVMWDLLDHEEVVRELAHVGNHWDLVQRLRPRSTMQLAQLLALIRPGKRHMVRQCETQGWASLDPEIWERDPNQNYTFKKSHAISLAVAIQVQLNLLIESTMDFG